MGIEHDLDLDNNEPDIDAYEEARCDWLNLQEELERTKDERLDTLPCDYDSELGKRYSDMESEEETTNEETKTYFLKTESAIQSERQSTSKSSTSDTSSEESSSSSALMKVKSRKQYSKTSRSSAKATIVNLKSDVERLQNSSELYEEKFQMMEKERRRDKESLYLRIGAIEDKLESEKNDKKNIINNFEEKMKSKNTELVEVKTDLQKIKNIKDTFEKDIKTKVNIWFICRTLGSNE